MGVGAAPSRLACRSSRVDSGCNRIATATHPRVTPSLTPPPPTSRLPRSPCALPFAVAHRLPLHASRVRFARCPSPSRIAPVASRLPLPPLASALRVALRRRASPPSLPASRFPPPASALRVALRRRSLPSPRALNALPATPTSLHTHCPRALRAAQSDRRRTRYRSPPTPTHARSPSARRLRKNFSRYVLATTMKLSSMEG
jgi:hypothetical protein